MKRLSKKDKIIDGTLRLIAKRNTLDITVREIAKEAKVNVAATNYYFSSKEQLFLEVNRLFMENFESAIKILDGDDDNDEAKLEKWLLEIIDYSMHYPGMFNILIEKLKAEEPSLQDVVIVAKLWECVAKFSSLLAKVLRPADGDEKKLFILFGSAIVFPCMIASYDIVDEFKLKTQEGKLQLIRMTLNIFRR